MMKHVLAALCVLAPLSAAAQSSIGDCEKIKNDMAYNQCLASFGPKVGQRAPRVGVGQDPESSASETPSRGRTRVVSGRRSGRQSASFDVVSGGSREVRRGNVSRGRSYGTRRHYRRRR